MIRLRRLLACERGYSLIELVQVAAILGVVLTGLTVLVKRDDAPFGKYALGQHAGMTAETSRRIYPNLAACRRQQFHQCHPASAL